MAKKDEVTLIDQNEKFANVLKNSLEVQSPFTKSGNCYFYNEELVMEYVTSSKCVWISNKFMPIFVKKHQLDIGKEIRKFLGKDTLNIYFEFDFNFDMRDIQTGNIA